jgi:hypothetical protein
MGAHTRHRTHRRAAQALHTLAWLRRYGIEVGWVVLLGALISYAVLRAELSALVLSVIGLSAVIAGLHWRGLAG